MNADVVYRIYVLYIVVWISLDLILLGVKCDKGCVLCVQ